MTAAPTDPGFTVLYTSYNAPGQHPAGLWVARTADEWQRCWVRLTENGPPGRPPPAVDWAGDMVLLFVVGARNSGGYVARIDRLAITRRKLVVHARERRPGRRAITPCVMTNPCVAVTTARWEGPVRLARRVETIDRA